MELKNKLGVESVLTFGWIQVYFFEMAKNKKSGCEFLQFLGVAGKVVQSFVLNLAELADPAAFFMD